MSAKNSKSMTGSRPGKVRVIGGTWGGRQLQIPEVPGLRPTPDRVRETLFNWLQGHIEGSRCLDLFAGTGVLGLEALSRGAAETIFVELNHRACASISNTLESFDGAQRGRVVCTDALHWLDTYNGPRLDMVFIDPPFSSDLAGLALSQLVTSDALTEDARVYLEQSSTTGSLELPSGWQVLREKRAGQVLYQLLAATRSGDL